MPEKPSQHCSIVIRAFNEEAHISRLLTGITKQTIPDVEIILVDSGSTDATITIASQFPVKILSIDPADFTYGRALNLGISQTQGEFIVIASAHVYPKYPDWLEKLLAPFEEESVALVYGKQRGDENTRFSERQFFAKWYPEVSTNRQPHPFCNNANAAIRRSLWDQHKYHENLAGLEDLDWAKWAMAAGKWIAYAAEAEVIHVHNEAPWQVRNRYQREAMAYKAIFPSERFSMWDFAHLYTTNVISDLWHAAREKALLKSASSVLWFRWMQFLGTYRGNRESGPFTAQLRDLFWYPRGFKPSKEDNLPERVPIQYGEDG